MIILTFVSYLSNNDPISKSDSLSINFFKVFHFSFNKLLLQKEELEQKHLHLLQVVESEKTAKWQYTQHCEELSTEIKKLREEVKNLSNAQKYIPCLN